VFIYGTKLKPFGNVIYLPFCYLPWNKESIKHPKETKQRYTGKKNEGF
jgi:hypothetical protein